MKSSALVIALLLAALAGLGFGLFLFLTGRLDTPLGALL